MLFVGCSGQNGFLAPRYRHVAVFAPAHTQSIRVPAKSSLGRPARLAGRTGGLPLEAPAAAAMTRASATPSSALQYPIGAVSRAAHTKLSRLTALCEGSADPSRQTAAALGAHTEFG